MDFTCQRPFALYGLILIVPALAISILQFRKVLKKIKNFTVKDSYSVSSKRAKHFKLMFVVRSFCLSAAWCMLILAYAGFSWGTYLEPVQTSGTAVSLVFDISYSMNADDAVSGLTRLEAAKKYANMLLSHIPDTQISVVLAKGDGVTVLPVTDDRAAVEVLIDSLSSQMMSSVGTSLGKGIKCAKKSFPETASFKSAVWVFTDGEETDGLLESSLVDCINSGISVNLIGFGSERETKVLAGDKKTYVMTALRSEKMKNACENASKKNSAAKVSDVQVVYVDSTEAGSALQVLDSISGKSALKSSSADSLLNSSVTYEIKPIQRYSLFLGLGILFIVLSYIVTELDPENISAKIHKKNFAALILFCLFFTSCKGYVSGSKNIMEGSWFWYQKRYNDSVAKFLQTVYDSENSKDEILNQYAVYNLATTYLVQNENDVAYERYSKLENAEDADVRFATFYNCGIIAYRKGDFAHAADCFRNALKIDGSKVDAKVNLELSVMNSEKEAKSKENALSQVSESDAPSAMEQAVFERIREYDKKQWKNSEKSDVTNSSQDY